MNGLKEKFLHPSAEFTPYPFWFWNDYLEKNEIERQMREFCQKGVNGFVIHPRQGLSPEIGYMTDKWLDLVEFAVEKARELNMKVILYDEAAYPSGSCHGQVVKENPKYAARGLFMRDNDTLFENECLIASAVHDGKHYFFVEADTFGTIRGLYENEDDHEPLAPRAADLLNPDAVACFIRLTHEKYYARLKKYFGNTVTAIFTDEPKMTGRCAKPCKEWTGGFYDEYIKSGLTDGDLYYLFRDTESERGKFVNQKYNTLVHNRLLRVYYGQIKDWCVSHNIALTGHPDSSMDIALLEYFDLPGQDIVWRFIYPGDYNCVEGEHSTLGKCASDAARHFGQRRNINECFGCCGHADDRFAFDREDMKWYIDWLFVRGCNLLIPHAFYYSLRGERVNECPPDVGMSRTYWKDYREITDYEKRCSFMNTDSVNITDIAVLCHEANLSWQAAKPLILNQIEFNYLEKRLLPKCRINDGTVSIKNQEYRVIIVPDGSFEDADEYLDLFRKSGGKVIYFDAKDKNYLQNVKNSSHTLTDISPREWLRMTHFKKDGYEFLFFTNEGEETIETALNAKVIEIWDAETGEITPYGNDKFDLVLPRRKSIYLRIA